MAKRKSSTKRKIHHKHFFVGGVVAFFLAGAAFGGLLLVTLSHNGAFGGHLHVFKPGQVIANDYYDVRIDDITSNNGDPQSLTPHAGKEFLVVDLYVKNKSTRVTQIFPSTQTYIKDATGQVYGLGIANVDNTFLGGDLSPGDQMKGKIVYEVPKGIQHPQFYLEGLGSLPVVVGL